MQDIIVRWFDPSDPSPFNVAGRCVGDVAPERYGLFEDTWLPLHFSNQKSFFRISERDIDTLKCISAIRCASGRDLRASDIEDLSNELMDNIRQGIEKSYCFVRLSHKSTKNSFAKKHTPFSTVRDVVDAITSSIPLFYTFSLFKHQYMLMTPWVDIPPSREYRVFVIDRQVLAISQQHCYDSYSYDGRESESVNDAVLMIDWYNTHKTSPGICEYNTVTLDMFIDANNKACLIECNPPSFGGHSGTSLFREHDMYIFNSHQVIVMLR